jgi:hypothetical protein
MPKTYYATLDAEMKLELNCQFIGLHRVTKAHLEHLQAMWWTRYRDNVVSSIDNNTSKYCGIKLTLDMTGHNSKHRHLKRWQRRMGRRRIIMFNTRDMGVPEGEVRTENRDTVEREVDRENLEMISRLENHTFENPHVMSQNPFDVLRYLMLSKMMHQDLVPKFVAWNRDQLSESIVSEITENTSQQGTNPLLLLKDHAQTNQPAEDQEEIDGQKEDAKDNCENYDDTLAHFDLWASDKELDHAHQGYDLAGNRGPIEPNNGKVGVEVEVTETTIVEESEEVVQTDDYQQPADEENLAMGMQGRGEEEQPTTDSTESSKKRKILPGTNNDGNGEDEEETEDMEGKSRNASICKEETVRYRCYQMQSDLNYRRSINS